jgi:hypothetical protein
MALAWPGDTPEVVVKYGMATADEALDAAFQAGALFYCPKHHYNIIRSNDPALKQRAYAIAAAKIDGGLFASERALLLQAIDDVIGMAQDECQCCAATSTYLARLSSGCGADKPCPCRWPACPAFRGSDATDYSI